MAGEAINLLAKARASRAGWKRKELESLYSAYGFIIKNGRGPHDKVYHPEYPQLVTWLPRHNILGEYNVENAIKLIDKLQQIKEQRHG
jgi:hypothetical protein